MKINVTEELVLTPEEIKILSDAAELVDKIYAEAAMVVTLRLLLMIHVTTFMILVIIYLFVNGMASPY